MVGLLRRRCGMGHRVSTRQDKTRTRGSSRSWHIVEVILEPTPFSYNGHHNNGGGCLDVAAASPLVWRQLCVCSPDFTSPHGSDCLWHGVLHDWGAYPKGVPASRWMDASPQLCKKRVAPRRWAQPHRWHSWA